MIENGFFLTHDEGGTRVAYMIVNSSPIQIEEDPLMRKLADGYYDQDLRRVNDPDFPFMEPPSGINLKMWGA